MKDHQQKSEPPIFIAESTLGKLAKWLRLAGLDTRLDTVTPDPIRLKRVSDMEHRVVLTRTQSVATKIGAQYSLFIRSNDAMDQARQVVRHFQIRPKQLCLMSRCANCNSELDQAPKADIRGRVPDYVLHQHDEFMICEKCGRIYWAGTHASRIKDVIGGWFRRP